MINIYCDESCHLEHDSAHAMIMGAISCPVEKRKRVYDDIRNIKKKHGLSSWTEIKWTGVSPSKIGLYQELLEYFYNEDALAFRAVVLKDKENLDHAKYNQGSHDLWYYKTYFYLLDAMVDYSEEYRIFVDIKDTCGGPRVKKLHNVLCNNQYDFKHEVIKEIVQIKSHESEILQLTDFIMGAIGYYHNGHYHSSGSSTAKNSIVDSLIEKYGSAIKFGTRRGEKKFDVFLWRLTK